MMHSYQYLQMLFFVKISIIFLSNLIPSSGKWKCYLLQIDLNWSLDERSTIYPSCGSSRQTHDSSYLHFYISTSDRLDPTNLCRTVGTHTIKFIASIYLYNHFCETQEMKVLQTLGMESTITNPLTQPCICTFAWDPLDGIDGYMGPVSFNLLSQEFLHNFDAKLKLLWLLITTKCR